MRSLYSQIHESPCRDLFLTIPSHPFILLANALAVSCDHLTDSKKIKQNGKNTRTLSACS